MRYGICSLSVIPARKNPDHKSEIVTEILYNDLYSIIEESHDWLKIKMDYDGYEGWIRSLQHHEITENEYLNYKNCKKFVTIEPVTPYNNMLLSFGTTVFEKIEDAIEMPDNLKVNNMTDNALKLINSPYLWGGKTVFGIDCSAFTQLCAKTAGIIMPRDASQQVSLGSIVYFLPEAQAGDLAFFENEEHHIVHVGIMLSNDKIIHASGNVRIDSIDQTGIFNHDLGCHTHNLCVIKRFS